MIAQLQKNVRGPWDSRVNNTPQYSPVGEPQLDLPTGALVLAGMVLTLVAGGLRRRPETWLWWLMMLAGWASTQLITVATPNGARGVGYMPTLLFFSSVSIDAILAAVLQLRMGAASSGFRLVAPAILGMAALLAGSLNVKHYVDWQNTPRTREARYLYVTAREFPEWSAAIVERARSGLRSLNVGEWRDMHPLQNRALPYGTQP
jgi:hypothetical protein